MSNIKKFKDQELLLNHNMFNSFCFDLTLKLNPAKNKKCYFLNLEKHANRRSTLTSEFNKSKDNTTSTYENFEFIIFSFSDENLKYLHNFMSTYEAFIRDKRKMEKILKSKIYGSNFENEFLHTESLNQKKYIEHFKLKMNLILEKIKRDEANLKEGKVIEPVHVVKGKLGEVFKLQRKRKRWLKGNNKLGNWLNCLTGPSTQDLSKMGCRMETERSL